MIQARGRCDMHLCHQSRATQVRASESAWVHLKRPKRPKRPKPWLGCKKASNDCATEDRVGRNIPHRGSAFQKLETCARVDTRPSSRDQPLDGAWCTDETPAKSDTDNVSPSGRSSSPMPSCKPCKDHICQRLSRITAAWVGWLASAWV